MVIVLLVFRALRSDRWRGTKLLWFLALYGLGRATTDFLRGDTDSVFYIGPLTITQLICLAAAAAALATLMVVYQRDTSRARVSHDD